MSPSRQRLALAAWLLSGAVQAAEFHAQAKVTSVQPIMQYETIQSRAPGCIDKPTHNAGLIALLEWDLALGPCRQTRREGVVEGYRVSYEWDGRVYHRTLNEPPGETLPVSIRVH